MSQTDKHSTRRIVLPSGREVEVVHDLDYPSARDLHVCPHCASELVQPSDWADGDVGRSLTLTCPNCDWQESGFYERDQVHELEDKLDEGLADLLGDLRRLAHANMADHVERFVAALQRDLILPEDF